MKTNRKTGTGTITGIIKRKASRLAWAAAVALCVLNVTPAQAQCTAENKAFKSGEKVSYNLYFNWKFIWINVGYATLTTETSTYHLRPAYRFDLLSHTSKKADLFFKMRDTLTCYVSDRLEPMYFCKAAEEGKRHTRDEAWFSYNDGVSHVRQRRTWYNPQRETEFMEYSDSTCIFDMLRILAHARSYNAADYKVGDRILFPMATGRRVEQQTLIYRGNENVEASNGVTYRCLVYSFVEYDKEGKENEVITFFISDDDNHLPIRLDMYLSFGSAKAFLKDVQGNRHPMTSIVKEE